LYDAGRISPRVTILSLPDDVLLDIFESCLPDPVERRAKAWPKLVHVCQRWRYIVFASPRRLDLRLLCTHSTPVREMLDVWPPLPIQIHYSNVDLYVEDNVIAAFEHRNRVRSIRFGRIWEPLERVVAVMQEPFPELESLSLEIYGMTMPALPNTFLGGSAPRLRSLHLIHIPFPTLPRLLLSTNDLVHLSLLKIPHSGYISPGAMATCVSALTRLTRLSIGFISPASRPDPITQPPPPLTRAVLPTLTGFEFYGVSEYLEDLMAQIEAPLVHHVAISFFNQLVFDIQQLIQFISHAPALMPFYDAFIQSFVDSVMITFRPRRQSSIEKFLLFKISCKEIDWQVSSVVQICNQLSFVLSSIQWLSIYEQRWILQLDMDNAQWLELFQPFTAVRTLRIYHKNHSLALSALRGLTGGSATQVLPALEELQLSWYQASQLNNWPFIVARQRSDHPVVVRKW
jgi:F-box-like